MDTWQKIAEQTRSLSQDLHDPQTIDLRPAWRAQAYREYAGQPEAIIRAQAFRCVLMRCSPHLYEGDLLCGSRMGWYTQALPVGMSESQYQELTAEHAARGQRDFLAGWDHSLADYPTLLKIGINGYLESARRSMREHTEPGEITFLESVIICLNALIDFIKRYAREAEQHGLHEMAACLRAIAGPPPTTLRQAMQLVWMTHIAFVSEGRYAMALGRLDQYLLPFYQRDLDAGRITRADALELFCHLWVHIGELAEVTNICIGGLTPEGVDATNELSTICLEATRLVQTPHANLSARFHDDTPDEFYRACFEVIRTGVGFPAIFNDHVLIPGLVEIGIPVEIARDHCMVGCIETMLAGRQQAWSDGRYNMPLQLMNAMRRLRGRPDLSYRILLEAFLEEMRTSLADYCRNINAHIAKFPSERFPDPFLSALTRGCIGRARDINNDGAEFPRMHGVAIMGLATTADSLAAVKKLVFEERQIPYDALMDAIDADFAGYEPMRQALMHRAPKYGNDEDEVDQIAAFLVDWTSRECLKHQIAGGGRFVSAMAANVSNIPAGREVGATPDGRHAFTPLSDAASPYFGRDIHGPTAFISSVSKPDYHRVLTGSVINMKFEPACFQGPEGEEAFVALMKVFVSNRVPELQFNFTGNEALLAAREAPELYRNLVVRVSGFSAYFTQLSEEVQNDIIRRRSHGRT